MTRIKPYYDSTRTTTDTPGPNCQPEATTDSLPNASLAPPAVEKSNTRAEHETETGSDIRPTNEINYVDQPPCILRRSERVQNRDYRVRFIDEIPTKILT